MKIFRLSAWEGQPGGAQLYVKTVTDYLKRRGHETLSVNIVTEEPDPDYVIGTSVKVGDSFREQFMLNIITNKGFVNGLYEIYREFSPDIVTLHSYGSPFKQMGEFIKRVDVPVLFNAHDSLLVCPINTLTKPGSVQCEGGVKLRCTYSGCEVGLKIWFDLLKRRFFDREIADRISAYLCPSRSLAEYLHSNGYRPAIHIPSFVEAPGKVEPNLIGDEINIGYIGRLEKWKGVQYLIEAFGKLSTKNRNVRLLIAGRGAYEDDLKVMASNIEGSTRVSFVGAVSNEGKEKFYSMCNVMVVPSSSWENHPLVAIEAQLREKPVVGTDFGGIKEIVEDGKTGFIIPVGDSEALFRALLKFTDNPEMIVSFGRAGRERASRRFTPEPHVEMLMKVYGVVLKRETLTSPLEMAVQ